MMQLKDKKPSTSWLYLKKPVEDMHTQIDDEVLVHLQLFHQHAKNLKKHQHPKQINTQKCK